MAARLSSKPARQAPKPDPAPVGHNSEMAEEAERIQLISFVAKATKTLAERDIAQIPYDNAKKAHNQVFSLAKAANPEWTRKYLEKKMDQMNRSPGENARFHAMESKHDRWLGILTPEQLKMHLEGNTPRETMDEMDWQGRGYSTGLRGMAPELPEGIPPRMDQPFMKGHGIGYAEYMAALEANVPGKSRLAQKAEADFVADNPEVDVAAAARKLKNDPKFMARGEPEDIGNEIGNETPSTEGKDIGNFEATPEELAAQAGRPDRSEEVV